MKEKLEEIYKRYDVKQRTENQTVTHQTYETETILTPEQFALFEAAVKSHYIATQVNFMLVENWSEFMGAMGYFNDFAFVPYMIDTPWIRDEWGQTKRDEASKDYNYVGQLLAKESGIDATTGEERNAYYATLD